MSHLQDVLSAYARAEQRMPEALAMFYTIELLKVLEAVHEAGVLHCHISLPNLLLRDKRLEEWGDWSVEGAGWAGKGLALAGWMHAVDMRQHNYNGGYHWRNLPSDISTRQCLQSMQSSFASGTAPRQAPDLACAAAVLHCILHGEAATLQPMQSNGKWTSGLPVASTSAQMWSQVFDGQIVIQTNEE